MKLQKRTKSKVSVTVTSHLLENFKAGRDRLYQHQISTGGPYAPYALQSYSLVAAGICTDVIHSNVAIRQLTLMGVLSNGVVNVSRLSSRTLAQSQTMLSIEQQRDVRVLLFWWNQECIRLRRLLIEEADLGACLSQVELSGRETDARLEGGEEWQWIEEMKFEREKLRMRIRQKPSERLHEFEGRYGPVYLTAGSNGEIVKPPPYQMQLDHGHDPPAYVED